MKILRLALTLLMLVFSVGTAAAMQTGAGSLPGTEWRLVSYGAPGSETPVLEGSEITLTFPAANQVAGSAGCNQYGGSYGVEQADIVFTDIVSTLIACADPEVNQQEQAYLEALRSASSYALAGNELTLWYANEQQRLSFVNTDVEADILTGSQWQLASYGDPDNQTLVVSGSDITLSFETATRVEGFGGCNGYGGEYEVAGTNLSFSALVRTQIACADSDVTEQEQAFFDALESATQFQGFFDRLFITYGDGQQLRFMIIANEGTPEPSSEESGCTGSWIVQPGDTLIEIADACGTTVDALLSANPDINDRSLIYVGQEIVIPQSEG